MHQFTKEKDLFNSSDKKMTAEDKDDKENSPPKDCDVALSSTKSLAKTSSMPQGGEGTEGLSGSQSSPSLMPIQSDSSPTKSKSSGLVADSADGGDLDASTLHGSLSRSKTMPPAQNGNKKSTSASINLARLKNAKQLAEKAIKTRKIFLVQGPYPAIREGLRRRGWVEKFICTEPKVSRKSPRLKRKMPAVVSDDDNTDDDDDDDDDPDLDDPNDHGGNVPPWEEDNGIYGIMSRIVRNSTPTFIYSVRRDVVDTKALKRDQIINHYGKAGSFTTKVGLCINMRNLAWFDSTNPETFFPRCYRLSHDEEKMAFIDDFRLTACLSLLKCVQRHNQSKSSASAKEGENEQDEAVKDDGQEHYICTNPQCTKACPNSNSSISNKCVQAPTSGNSTQNSPRKNNPQGRSLVNGNVSNLSASDLTNLRCACGSVLKKKKKIMFVPLRAVEIALGYCEKHIKFLGHDDIDETADPYTVSEADWDTFIQWYYKVVHEDAMVSRSSSRALETEAVLGRLKDHLPQFEADGTRNVWIVKPGAKSRGRGIMCYDRLEDMLRLVSSSVVKKEGKYVVQKYIERPLLIYNTKFDIRQWFLVTDWNPLTIWIYKDSYLRFCSQEYTLKDLDEAIHLSNNAIQKNYENGPRSRNLPAENMWTCQDFQQYLSDRGVDNMWDTIIYPGMKKAVANAIMCSQDLVESRKSAFELYGADFMLTEDFRPWLIEINSSPSMASSTKITSRLCNSVLDDVVKVVLDRKYDKNADIGRFELAYRQPHVAVPPYIGINLTVDGMAVKKPAYLTAQQKKPTPPAEPPTQELVAKGVLPKANLGVGGPQGTSSPVTKSDSNVTGQKAAGKGGSNADVTSGSSTGAKKVFTQNYTHLDKNEHASKKASHKSGSVAQMHKNSNSDHGTKSSKKQHNSKSSHKTDKTDDESPASSSHVIESEAKVTPRKTINSPVVKALFGDNAVSDKSGSRRGSLTDTDEYGGDVAGVLLDTRPHSGNNMVPFRACLGTGSAGTERKSDDGAMNASTSSTTANGSNVVKPLGRQKTNKITLRSTSLGDPRQGSSTDVVSDQYRNFERTSLPMKNVETVDLQTIQSDFQKVAGLSMNAPGPENAWGRICTHCGSGNNIKLDKTKALQCDCQRDSIRTDPERGWMHRSTPYMMAPTPPSRPRSGSQDGLQRVLPPPPKRPLTPNHSPLRSKSPSLPQRILVDQHKLVASVYAKAQQQVKNSSSSTNKFLLKYTDAHIPKPEMPSRLSTNSTTAFPKLVARYVGKRSKETTPVCIESYKQNQLTIITQSFQ